MTGQGLDADASALVLRPLGWREADGVARLWRDLLVLACWRVCWRRSVPTRRSC